MQPKKKILVNGEDGLITDEEEQVEITTNFFEKVFNNENMEEMDEIQPIKMKQKFKAKEVETAIKSLKNNKSPGIDNINAELLKYGPNELNQEIADIFNAVTNSDTNSEARKNPGTTIKPPSYHTTVCSSKNLKYMYDKSHS